MRKDRLVANPMCMVCRLVPADTYKLVGKYGQKQWRCIRCHNKTSQSFIRAGAKPKPNGNPSAA